MACKEKWAEIQGVKMADQHAIRFAPMEAK